MPSYRNLFRTPEFTPLFLLNSAQVAAQTVGSLALGTLVFNSTGSPLLAALAMFGSALAQVLGAATLLRAADRLPPRATLAGLSLLFAAGTALQAAPGLPEWALFGLLLVLGMAGALGGGVRYGLLSELLPGDQYPLGRAALNVANGLLQVCGFAVGGVLTAVLTPGQTLLLGAALHLTGAIAALLGLSRRTPRAAAGHGGVPTARLLADRARRSVYLALWVPNGLIVGCESLFLPYAPRQAGLLLSAAAAGMLLGDAVVGRFLTPRLRARLGIPLNLLLAAPYLLFAVHPPLALALMTAAVASVGYAAALPLQEQLLARTPATGHGQALGLHSAGMGTAQGLSAALAGAVAEHAGPAVAIALLAAGSLAVTSVLAPGLADRPR
ncbi:putative MFS family arabinose efflux permease [Kitasatospora sp. GP30]|uniref:MFS transporter n=1 Tax=Kitasatospora sp. GP30 TaxID=3035084 RepID=UPI000C706CA5|nr:MFS transporter [Kitasatospora sp. GP30]MDH6142393.1 putative MFS family arabinose efflux permease [Kitasatospora sp. GP30]